MAEARPASPADLIKIAGLGAAKVEKYGQHVLAVLAQEKAPAEVLEPRAVAATSGKGLHTSAAVP